MRHTPLTRRLAPALVLGACLITRPAHAVNKDMVQLQTQVQQLMDAVARLQQSNDERMGVMRDLLQQTVDSVNKMSTTVNGLQLSMGKQADAQGTRNDQLSGQVQALNDSLDELKARIQRMEKSVGDIQSQSQFTNALLSNLPGASGAPGGAAAGGANVTPAPSGTAAPAAPPTSANPGPGDASNVLPDKPAPSSPRPAPVAGPPASDMYRAAYSDYMAGKYPLAAGEFSDLVKAYPDDNLSGNAFFYMGEISRRTDKPSAAIKQYDDLLERYPDNQKIPAAHLHKGEALIALKQTDAGVRELRALIQRFPNSPEAAQAHTRLTALGAATSARRDR